MGYIGKCKCNNIIQLIVFDASGVKGVAVPSTIDVKCKCGRVVKVEYSNERLITTDVLEGEPEVDALIQEKEEQELRNPS